MREKAEKQISVFGEITREITNSVDEKQNHVFCSSAFCGFHITQCVTLRQKGIIF